MKKKVIALLISLVFLVGSCGIANMGNIEKNAPVFKQGITFVDAATRTLYHQTAYLRVVLDNGVMGQGSGVVVGLDRILTAGHMVPENTTSIMVYLPNGQTMNASVQRLDRRNDLAIIKTTEIMRVNPIKISDLPAAVGQEILICGSSYGERFANTISKGIIAGDKRVWNKYPSTYFYQTDALVVGGNSGGPWINSNGELVAITSWAVQGTGNVGFGVPEHYIREIVNGRSSSK